MREALEKHPALGDHRLPLAFVSEKLAQSGGEASGEIKNGPSQESYDQRALPRKTISSAQQKGAARAFGKARSRPATAAGRAVQRKAAGAARAAAVPTWTSAGPDGGIQVEEATYTGTPAFVSGRTTSLAARRDLPDERLRPVRRHRRRWSLEDRQRAGGAPDLDPHRLRHPVDRDRHPLPGAERRRLLRRHR